MRNLQGFNPFAQQFGGSPQIQQPPVRRHQEGNPFANTGSAGGPGGDELSLFKTQIKSGQLNLNPNQPRAGEGLGRRLNVSV